MAKEHAEALLKKYRDRCDDIPELDNWLRSLPQT
jgi:hypothetical protein